MQYNWKKCFYDENFTIQYVSDIFLGFTKEEIKQKFDNQYILMIYEKDRDTVFQFMQQQWKKLNYAEAEYRVVHKSGEFIWVLEKSKLMTNKNGEQSIYSTINDITEYKRKEERLELELEKYRTIINQTGDILFEWNFKTNTISFSSNLKKKFGYKIIENLSMEKIEFYRYIFEKDQINFEQLKKEILEKVPYVESELRIRKVSGIYIWCRIRVSSQFDKSGNPIKAIGVIIDIDTEKRNSQNLLKKAEKDTLTNLYNKGTTQKLIEDCLCSDDIKQGYALFIIDVDDFKKVNDSRGHFFGDAFLIEVAHEIKKLFRKEDIVGRIGGDEFIVFMKGITNIAIIQYRAEQIIKGFSNIYANEIKDIGISCSIGIALVPYHGKRFQELFRKADHALYQAKKQGKSRYVIYDSTKMNEFFMSLPKEVATAINERIDYEEENKTINNKLVEYVFRILYKSMDIETAVNTILEVVGKQFDVSRVYIFENSEDNLYCYNTFEWCNTGIEPEINNLQELSYEQELNSYTENFNEEDIFYCRDVKNLPEEQYKILAPQKIKSMLQCAIRDNGVFKGYVGFDECSRNRFWTQEQINVLSFISEILSTFLLKKRAQDKVIQAAEGMKTILDNQNTYIYIIDKKNYELEYINKKTTILAPEAQLGMKCYKVFFNRKVPCEICPAKDIGKDNISCMLEVYNPILDIWSLADASYINWKGKEACLLCCHEITKYKKE